MKNSTSLMRGDVLRRQLRYLKKISLKHSWRNKIRKLMKNRNGLIEF
jgi:hypothetical protein